MDCDNSSTPPQSRSETYQHTDPVIPSQSMTDLPLSNLCPSTPTKKSSSSSFRAPVTPSTVQKYQPNEGQAQNRAYKVGSSSAGAAPLLHPPNTLNPSLAASLINSPFNGLKSPEFTDETIPSPQIVYSRNNDTQLDTRSNTSSSSSVIAPEIVTTPSLKSVSRKLFPLANDGDDTEFASSGKFTLEPLGSPVYFKSEQERERERDELDYAADRSNPLYSNKEHQKLVVPGTPNDKIITFELSEKWVNREIPRRLCKASEDGTETETATETDDSDDEGSILVSKGKEMENPFLISEVPSEETRRLRQEKLLRENPDIDRFVTYVDKYGDTVARKPRSHLRPKMLFKEQLKNNNNNNRQGDESSSRSSPRARSKSPKPGAKAGRQN